ncbi:hypothetical protein M3P36_00500 [Altererythrobacter sp. KTW20L]|uniref:hypothetical protein n=1 Tax=Altererythrobacter sp. KTW20L TaxID=2942210 RepID=UPI0020BF316E|nr:hypothetical protein [Altererythrobacter sp. KTW20L]MCL6249528.1 hypothetical protein [Altererythrobacter sp. KTW20L]
MATVPQPAVAGHGATRHPVTTAIWPLGALAILFVLQATMVFTRAINWDEFFFWHEVAQFSGGQLDRPLQTFHVRLFGWLPPFYTNSVDGIVTARLFMLGCEMVTVASITVLAQRFTDWQTALFAGLLYLSAGYVLQHGMSFRADPMLAATLTGALAILGTSRLSIPALAAFGLLCGLAGMLSMKAVLFAPAFVALAWLRACESGFSLQRLLQLAGGGVATGLFFALLYIWHSTGLVPESDAVGQGGKMIGISAGWMFFIGLPVYAQMAIKSMLIAPILYVWLLATPLVIARSSLDRAEKVALAGLWLPIVSLFFYANTAAYFYAFILPPVVVACCLPLRWGIIRFGPQLMTLSLMVTAVVVWVSEDRAVIDRQRQVVENVHEIFGQPVTYIDQNFMLADWPKANGFMTPWGMSSYYEANRPAYRTALGQQTVPMILANSADLLAMLEGDGGLLLPEDAAAIRNNFRLFSWPIWVAGKEYPASSTEFGDEFLVPGAYTLQGGPLEIDGLVLAEGMVIHLDRGIHRIRNPGLTPVTLTWGDHLRQPSRPLRPDAIHVDF